MPRTRDPEEQDAGDELAELADRLAGRESKDALIKHLKAAARLLEQLGQDERGKEQTVGFARVLDAPHILKHKDKVLRIWAPDTPYSSDAVLSEMFAWLLVAFRRLDQATDPHFQMCLSVLHVAAQTKCCLLLYDVTSTTATGLIFDTFETLLDAICDDTAAALQEPVVELLSSLLMEADHIDQELLDLILTGLLPPKCTENPALARATESLIKRADQRLRPTLQKFLMSIIEGRATGSDLKQEYHTLIYQVYRISPQTLLPVLPKLAAELSLDQEGKRLAALQLLGKLLAVPGSGLDVAHEELFKGFLKRAVDQKLEVRQAFLKLCPAVVKGCSAASQGKILEAMEGRLMDWEDKVRSAAVAAVCEAAIQAPEAVTLKALEEVAGRLRDRKLPVRKEAAQKLMALFSARSRTAADREIMPSQEELVLWIPGRICAAAAAKDPDLLHYTLDNVLRHGLLPAALDSNAAAKLLGAVYMESSAQERAAIMRLVKIQAATRNHLRAFLDSRSSGAAPSGTPAGTPPSSGPSSAALAAALTGLARTFPDQQRALDNLQKLRKHPDNHVFRALAALCAPGVDAPQLTKDVTQRLGGRGGLPELCRQLSARLAPGLLSPATLAAATSLLIENGPDDDFGQALLKLLGDAVAANPHPFATMADQVWQLLEQDDSELTWLAAHLLAHAGSVMRQADSAAAARCRPAMRKLCLEGSRRAAKAAVRGLANLLEPGEAERELRQLCEELLDGLEPSERYALARLEALSGIGRILPTILGEHIDRLLDCALQELVEVDSGAPAVKYAASDAPLWARGDAADLFKARMMKALARAIVPDETAGRPPQATMAALKRLEEALVAELSAGDLDSQEDGPADSECLKSFGYRRLAAAAGLLRLARIYDSHLAVDSFLQLALSIQDSLSQVRAEVAGKLVRMIGRAHHQSGGARSASKYAAMLALAAVDPVSELRASALSSLRQFAASRRAVALRKDESAAGGCPTLHEHPEFLLPYLVQVLAHHPDWPSPEELEEDPQLLQPFASILHFALHALLLPDGASPQAIVASHMRAAKLLRTIKTTRDATAAPATQALHQVCDLGLLVARRLLSDACKENRPEAPRLAGGCPLPQQLFKPADRRIEKRADGGTLPQGFRLQLEPLPGVQPSRKKRASELAAPLSKPSKSARATPSQRTAAPSVLQPAARLASADQALPSILKPRGSICARVPAAATNGGESSMAAATRMDHGGMGSPLGDASGIEVSPAADAERESGGKGGDTSLQVSPLEAAVSPDADMEGGGHTPTVAAAKAKPAHHKRELASLLEAAHDMGVDTDPRSPRSLRSSPLSRSRSGPPVPSPPKAVRNLAEIELRAATSGEGEETARVAARGKKKGKASPTAKARQPATRGRRRGKR